MSQPTIEQAFQTAFQHHQAGELSQATELYRQILVEQPQHVGALHYLGVLAHQAGRNDVAVDLIRRSLAFQPDNAEAFNNLAVALSGMNKLDEAIAVCHQALSLKPNYAEAYGNLGNAQRDKGQLDEAVAAYRRALAIKPNFAEMHCNLGNVLKDQSQLDEAIMAFRRAIALKPNYLEAHSNLVYTIHFHPDYDARTIADEHRRWNRQHGEPLKRFVQTHANDRKPDRRLRIGYVSPNFRLHPIGRFLLPLFAHHDKSQVEVFAYSQSPVVDEVTEQLRLRADCWRNIVGLADADAADLIRNDKIDILVDLTMHMAYNRLLIFTRKPAPVQVTYLAYCSTTGLETIDYRLSDPHLDPPGMDESVYSERTIRLPETYWCYQPIVAVSEVSALPALKQGFVTFGSLNNFCKVSEPTLVVWAAVLRAVPKSQLLLNASEGSHRQRVLDRLEREGIEPQRVRFVSHLPVEKYFGLYGQIDIALDPFPHGGGTTSCDALWMGVPVVSLTGRTAVGRGGLSILSNVGMQDLVAHSAEAYVQIATELAKDLPRLSNLRLTLRRRMEQSPLMDAPRFVRNIEATYRQMWNAWCSRL
jgi:protein O-GlcNAc transferase